MENLINFLKKHIVFISILLLTILGFVLRIKLGLPELANDEIATITTSSQSFPKGILNALLTKNLHAPLFYFILHFWMKCFGESDFVLRLLPVLLGTACIPVSYLCAKELVSKSAGIITAILVCTNFFLITFSHFCKFYSLLQLLGFLSIYFLIKFDKSNKEKFLYLLAVVNAMIVYTYVLGFLYVVIQGLFYFFYKKFIQKNSEFIYAIKYILALFILILPVIPFIFKVVQNTQNASFPTFWWYNFGYSHIIAVVLSWFSPALPYIFRVAASTDLTMCYFSYEWYHFFMFNLIPLTIALIGFSKIFFKKSILSCLVYISILFILSEFFAAMLGKFAFCSRYTTIAFPAIIIAVGCGFSLLKVKKFIPWLLVSFIILSNVIFCFVPIIKGFNVGNSEIPYIAEILESYDLKPYDFVIIPLRGYYLSKYLDTSKFNYISYDINYSYKLNDEKVLNNIYDKEDVILDKDISALKKYEKYINSEKPSKAITAHLKNECFNKLVPESRVFLISHSLYSGEMYAYREIYKDNIFRLLATKINYDIENILMSKLKCVNVTEKYTFRISEFKK